MVLCAGPNLLLVGHECDQLTDSKEVRKGCCEEGGGGGGGVGFRNHPRSDLEDG